MITATFPYKMTLQSTVALRLLQQYFMKHLWKFSIIIICNATYEIQNEFRISYEEAEKIVHLFLFIYLFIYLGISVHGKIHWVKF